MRARELVSQILAFGRKEEVEKTSVDLAAILSDAMDLLRASLSPAPVDHLALRLAAIVGLGMASFVGGTFLLRRVLDRVRALGTMTYA